jgi:hypothetical protein
MMLLLLFTSSALADDDVVAVPEGKKATVMGPAVYMNEDRFTKFLVAEQTLPLCQDQLERSTQLAIDATQQTIGVLEAVQIQLQEDEVVIEALRSDLAAVMAERDHLATGSNRLRAQRNVAVSVAGGLLAATAAAVIIAF